jgi:DNA repair exonuclease SbcCD ATPase subunit
MIVFKTVRWKNFLSYGNSWTELDLTRSPSTMILGKNGSGKSSVLEVLCYGLFGKPYRKIKKGDLVNTKNGGGAIVEITFTDGQDDYLIRRAIKPDAFEVYKNDELQNAGSNKDYQKKLESIIRMDYASACQTVFVGKAQHTTFMQLETWRRRAFVEVMLNLIVFSKMSKIHFNRNSELKTKIQELKNGVSVLKEKLKLREAYIRDLESADKSAQDAESDKLTSFIKAAETELNSLYEQKYILDDAGLKFDNVTHQHALQDLKAKVQVLAKIDAKIMTLEDRKMILGSGDHCYTCGQAIEPEENARQMAETLTKLTQLEQAKVDLSTAIAELEASIAEFETKFESYNEHTRALSEIKSKIESLEAHKLGLEAELSQDRVGHLDKIKDAKKDLVNLEHLLTKMVVKLEREVKSFESLQIIGSMLSDAGIKATIIKRFIPIINQAVNKYLNHLGLFVRFELDEQFEETIMSRGIDKLSYHSYSEGEKLRMDMALLLAWREIARLQGNVSTNLLILDEVADSSLDAGGAEVLADLLTSTQDLNVFIVTHTPEKILDKVRSVIKIDREGGFSKIV